jgi:hypothetical protein
LDKLKEARSSEEITPKTWFMVLVELDVYSSQRADVDWKRGQLRLRAIVTRDKMMLQRGDFAFALTHSYGDFKVLTADVKRIDISSTTVPLLTSSALKKLIILHMD